MLIVLWSYTPNKNLEILVEDGNVKHTIKINQTIGCPGNIYYISKIFYELIHDSKHDTMVFHWVTI